MTTRWANLNPQQQEAARAAARLVEEAGMAFVFLLFNAEGVGAVISNIEPGDATPMIEQALKAAKANTGLNLEPLDNGRERLQ